MSKVKFIRQIDEREYCTVRLIIVNFGINLSAKLSKLERGKIQEYLSPPNLLS